MGTLYIIGNGFDLHFDLKTEPERFREILKTKGIYNESDNALDILAYYGVNWSGFEESLAEIDLGEIELRNLMAPDYLSDHESDRDGVILNMDYHLSSIYNAIFSSLEDMVSQANEKTQSMDRCDLQSAKYESNDAIISFNYTSTIENLFGVPPEFPLWHIHGYYAGGENLIFGYGVPKRSYEVVATEDEDYYVFQQKSFVSDFYHSLRKELRLRKLEDFLYHKCRRIDKVRVYGHSLGRIDSEYMEKIEQFLHPAVWEISYHLDNDPVLTNAQHYSFSNKIHFFRW